MASATTVSTPIFRGARVGRFRVLLTRLPNGEVVAFAPDCPHEGTSLTDASVFEGRIRCPRHNYIYDPATGENILPARDVRPERLCRLKPGYLRTHPVQEQDGWIWVSDVPNPPPSAYDPDLESGTPAEPGGAGPPPDRTETPSPGPAAPRTVTAAVGTDFELALSTRPRPAHLWQVQVDGPAAVILGETTEWGDRHTVRVRLAARQPGDATVRGAYTQPWAAVPHEVQTVTVHVQA